MVSVYRMLHSFTVRPKVDSLHILIEQGDYTNVIPGTPSIAVEPTVDLYEPFNYGFDDGVAAFITAP